jgi:hypothetical protein
MTYSITERLTRQLAEERLRYLSDAYTEAIFHNDHATARAIEAERKTLRDQYFKVMK